MSATLVKTPRPAVRSVRAAEAALYAHAFVWCTVDGETTAIFAQWYARTYRQAFADGHAAPDLTDSFAEWWTEAS